MTTNGDEECWDINNIDNKFPTSLHCKPAEGLQSGECGWATINFMADHLKMESENITNVQDTRSTSYTRKKMFKQYRNVQI